MLEKTNRIRNTYMITGLIMAGVAVVGIVLVLEEWSLDTDDVIAPLVASFAVIGAGIALFIAGPIWFKNRMQQLERTGLVKSTSLTPEEQKFKGILKVYPVIPLKELAKKLGLDEDAAEGKVIDLVNRGIVHGYINASTREFVSGTSSTGGRVSTCPHCNASLDTLLVKGISTRCKACGQMIVA